jgi:hypothetical protein
LIDLGNHDRITIPGMKVNDAAAASPAERPCMSTEITKGGHSVRQPGHGTVYSEQPPRIFFVEGHEPKIRPDHKEGRKSAAGGGTHGNLDEQSRKQVKARRAAEGPKVSVFQSAMPDSAIHHLFTMSLWLM